MSMGVVIIIRKPHPRHVAGPTMTAIRATGRLVLLCISFPIFVCLWELCFGPLRYGFQSSFSLVTVCEPGKSRNVSKLTSFPRTFQHPILSKIIPVCISGAGAIIYSSLSLSVVPCWGWRWLSR